WDAPGLLTTGRQNGPLLLVLIPDLTRLTLAAARACVMLMGSDVAHLARHGASRSSSGAHEQWVPDICWLAGCDREHVGQLSPHLLDRFALRLHGANAPQVDRGRAVSAWANAPSSEAAKDVAAGGIDEALKEQLQAAAHRWATITPAAMASIHSDVPIVAVESARRSIALARLALADARLKGDTEVTAAHVEAAVRLIGLRVAIQPTREPSPAPETPSDVGMAPERPDNAAPKSSTASERPLNKASLSEETQKPVYQAPESPTPFEPTKLSSDPYPEDDAPVEREATPLRLALPSRRTASVARGPAIGVQPATDLNDLSVVGTILAAAKYQPIRRQNSEDQKALGADQRAWWWRSSDLRRYRRLPVAEKMLLLVLDYTCLDDVDWQNALFPYLRWAYVERATIGIVQVGVAIDQTARDAPIHPDELRAKLVTARRILTPRIDAALMAQAGRATPLAHGLELAYQTLRNALQHGRHTIRQAWLVVLTDGRGNVPLEASQSGQIQLPINREGIEDAQRIAQQLRTLSDVQVTLLDPQPQQHAELPVALAEALGAAHVSIPLLEEELG
ncbi:MAG: hypothetical protein ACPGWR_16410, partial [Ardenticatenaceae bacterium]